MHNVSQWPNLRQNCCSFATKLTTSSLNIFLTRKPHSMENIYRNAITEAWYTTVDQALITNRQKQTQVKTFEQLSWWHIGQFLVPESGAGFWCPKLRHFASKWYWQKKKNNLDFKNFEDDDVTATVFFILLCELKNALIIPLHLSSLLTNKRAVLSSAQTDQSQFSFPAGFRHEIEHALTGAGFWHQESMTVIDRLTSFWHQLTGTKNRRLKLVSVSSLLVWHKN